MVILYVYAIRQSRISAEATIPASQAATTCQAQITSIATPGSLAERYGLVLQELQLELLSHDMNLEPSIPHHTDNDVTVSQALTTDRDVPLGEGQAGDTGVVAFDYGLAAVNSEVSINDGTIEIANASPTSSNAHITGWDRFDSFVSIG